MELFKQKKGGKMSENSQIQEEKEFYRKELIKTINKMDNAKFLKRIYEWVDFVYIYGEKYRQKNEGNV